MKKRSLSEVYAVAAIVVLALLVWLNRPPVTIPVAVAALAAGAWVAQREPLRRATVLALVAFVLSIAFAVFTLLR